MLHGALDLCTDGPAAIRYPRPCLRIRPTRSSVSAAGLATCRLRTGSDVCLIGVGKMLAAGPARRTDWRPRSRRHVVDPGGQTARPEMLADAASHRLVITVEDGLRRWHRRCDRRLAVQAGPGRRAAGPGARHAVGVPGPGKPDAILSRLGLDADGMRTRPRPGIRSADPARSDAFTTESSATTPTTAQRLRCEKGSRPRCGRWRRPRRSPRGSRRGSIAGSPPAAWPPPRTWHPPPLVT